MSRSFTLIGVPEVLAVAITVNYGVCVDEGYVYAWSGRWWCWSKEGGASVARSPHQERVTSVGRRR
jgi:hypothetical protein